MTIKTDESQSEKEKKKKQSKVISNVKGKYAHLQTSSEEFAKRKQIEIEREERNS